MLFGSSPSLMEETGQSVVPTQDNFKQNLMPARCETKQLSNNDLRHRIIKGAIPRFSDDVSDQEMEKDLPGLQVMIDKQNNNYLSVTQL